MSSTWRRLLVATVASVTVLSGATHAAADDGDRVDGADPAHGSVAEGTAAALTLVPMPDLGITHRLPGGGMNLWRIPLSEVEADVGQPQLVKSLNYGGFSYDNSVTLTGDFADVTSSDDGTADHIVWHAQPNGGVLLWAVGGGSDTTPRLWQDLRTGGWSWANSRPMVGDVTGDGWDDLVVRHWSGCTSFYCTVNVWVFPSDGVKLEAPQLWNTDIGNAWIFDGHRYLLADYNFDGLDDWIAIGPSYLSGVGLTFNSRPNTGPSFGAQSQTWFATPGEGWSYGSSRQLAGDVTGDGLVDLVSVHAQPSGGVLVWVHPGCSSGSSLCLNGPQLWQDLRTGGWSYAGSRWYLADTDGDWVDDLITVHSQGGNPGELIWRHLSTGVGLAAPQVLVNLKTGGWTYLASREAVAGTYGWADI
jgi:hypothetical protein